MSDNKLELEQDNIRALIEKELESNFTIIRDFANKIASTLADTLKANSLSSTATTEITTDISLVEKKLDAKLTSIDEKVTSISTKIETITKAEKGSGEKSGIVIGLLGVFLVVLIMVAINYIPSTKFIHTTPDTKVDTQVKDTQTALNLDSVKPNTTQDVLGNCKSGTQAWQTIQKIHQPAIIKLIDDILHNKINLTITLETEKNLNTAQDKLDKKEDIRDWKRVSNALFQYIIAVTCRNTGIKCEPALTTIDEKIADINMVTLLAVLLDMHKKSTIESSLLEKLIKSIVDKKVSDEFRDMVIFHGILEASPELTKQPLCESPVLTEGAGTLKGADTAKGAR